jgi:hypothetical protein
MRLNCSSKALKEISRKTGIPVRQHHVHMSVNGRMFFPSKVVKQLGLTVEDGVCLTSLTEEGCTLCVRADPDNTMPHHLTCAPQRNTPCILTMRHLATLMRKMGYTFPRRMRFCGSTDNGDGSRSLHLDFRPVRDMFSIAEQHHWFDEQVGKL